MFFEKAECLASTYKSGGLSDKLPKKSGGLSGKLPKRTMYI